MGLSTGLSTVFVDKSQGKMVALSTLQLGCKNVSVTLLAIKVDLTALPFQYKTIMNKTLIRIIATAVLLVAAYAVTSLVAMPVWVQLLIYLVPYLLISYDVLEEAVEGILKLDPFDENFLMVVATIGALLIGFMPGAEPQMVEAVFVMLFFQLGEYFEDYAEDRSRKSISDLMDLRPDTATVERGGSFATIAPEEVRLGETLIISPGEKVALDGTIIEGHSALNTVALTGESMPREVAEGDSVISGCVNLSGLIRVRVEKEYGESTAAKIIQMVEESAENKSESVNFIHRFAKVYTPIVVVLAVLVAFIPPFFMANYAAGLAVWGYRALSFLVVSCPCALVISVPLTFFAGIGGASRKGILIKGGNYMDALAKVSTVVFDKTGTLTKGSFAVNAVHIPDNSPAEAAATAYADQQLLHLAAHVEHNSPHPIAAAIRGKYPVNACHCTVENVEEVAGHGARATVDGHQVAVGNEKLMAQEGAAVTVCPHCGQWAGSKVHIAVDGRYAGHILIADEIKDDADRAIDLLKRQGVRRTVMLTGDNEQVAHAVAGQIGIDEAYSSLLPADKVNHMKRLIASSGKGERVAFVGDGINDAPVLALADVGIAMGALGSDAAIEAADVVLMDDKPSKIATAIAVARRTIAIAKQNIWFAIGIKIIILLLVAAGALGSWAMPVAAFGDVGVMLIAVLNAMRALRI